MDFDGDATSACNLAEKGCLALIAFDQMNLWCAHKRENEAGQAGAAAQVDQSARSVRPVLPELPAVEDVAPPRVGQRRGADQVDPGLPAAQQVEIDFKPIECFT